MSGRSWSRLALSILDCREESLFRDGDASDGRKLAVLLYKIVHLGVCAAAFVMPRDAHFVAWYAKTPGKPVIPPREETLMIEPPLADIDAMTAFIPRNTPS